MRELCDSEISRRLRSAPDTAAAADAVEPVLEIPAEEFVSRLDRLLSPDRTQAPDQSRDPIGGLKCLVTVTLDIVVVKMMKWALSGTHKVPGVSSLAFSPTRLRYLDSGNAWNASIIGIRAISDHACSKAGLNML